MNTEAAPSSPPASTFTNMLSTEQWAGRRHTALEPWDVHNQFANPNSSCCRGLSDGLWPHSTPTASDLVGVNWSQVHRNHLLLPLKIQVPKWESRDSLLLNAMQIHSIKSNSPQTWPPSSGVCDLDRRKVPLFWPLWLPGMVQFMPLFWCHGMQRSLELRHMPPPQCTPHGHPGVVLRNRALSFGRDVVWGRARQLWHLGQVHIFCFMLPWDSLMLTRS